MCKGATLGDEQLQGNHASLNIDLSGVAGTWCLAYLCLPEEFREEARRAAALNFMVSAEGALSPDWEAKVPKIVAYLRGDAPQTVVPFAKPVVVNDG
jgi:hypothetical protein